MAVALSLRARQLTRTRPKTENEGALPLSVESLSPPEVQRSRSRRAVVTPPFATCSPSALLPRPTRPFPTIRVTGTQSLRKLYGESPVQPGDYVQLTRPRWSEQKSRMPFRVIDIETEENEGVTLDDPYYVLDTSEPGQRYRSSYHAQKREFEVVGRPYLKS